MTNKMDNKLVELMDEDLDMVTGGAVFINRNTGKVGFSTTGAVYKYKNCNPDQIVAMCNSLAGKFATEAEYDAAIESALKAKGWI